ncbi:MAG: hypothetical protein GC157_02640 [Frankiales bacterium]|nr:hypothetical protein [Frankiales bacterium]
MSRESATSSIRSLGLGAGLVVLVTGSAVLTSWLVGTAVTAVVGDKMAPWILGRAAGITSYLLLVGLVVMGLVLSHPASSTWRRPSPAVRIRTHVSLSVFTLVFTALHIVVLATDQYAGVGWWGAFVPMGASYRPLPMTLGVIALYAGLAAGITAALAGRVSSRLWWPIHKVAIVSLVLVWLHGVLAGIDTPLLMVMYVATGFLVVVLAVSRYLGESHRDEVEELARVRANELMAPDGSHRPLAVPRRRRSMELEDHG